MRLMHWRLKLNRSVMNFKYSSSFYFDDLFGRVVNAMGSVLDVKDKRRLDI